LAPGSTGDVAGLVTESYREGTDLSIGKSVRPGNAGQLGLEDTMPPCNVVCRPAGANPARLRVSPPEPVASLATGPAMASAMRRQANVRAMGQAAPTPLSFPDAQGPDLPEGHNGFSVWWARKGPYPAGCSTMARRKRTAP